MTITIKKLPELKETYFIDEAKAVPTAHWGIVQSGRGYLGPHMNRQAGNGIMAGWALTVECPNDNNMASFVALQYMQDIATQGRFVMVIAPPSDSKPAETALWTYLHSSMGWEVGFTGAVIAGHMRDSDEIREKLKNEFSVFSYGSSPIPARHEPAGQIGFPVNINGVTINTGDLIVGDNDGVIVIPGNDVEKAIEACREEIVEEVNLLQHVREGLGAVDVLNLRDDLKGKVNLVE